MNTLYIAGAAFAGGVVAREKCIKRGKEWPPGRIRHQMVVWPTLIARR